MKNFFIFNLVCFGILVTSCSQPVEPGRENFNQQWNFYLGTPEKAEDPDFDDSGWRKLNLPHDWSIEGKFSADNPASPGGGALPGGTGWYRKSFTLPASAEGKKIFIDFDGVYCNSEVWINGHYLGIRPNGYISFRYDLTPFVRFGNSKNVIAVKVDNSRQPNSRWYSGSGIYRNVWLVTKGDVYFDNWGTTITTPEITGNGAVVAVVNKILNGMDKGADIEVKTMLYDSASLMVASATSQVNIGGMQSGETGQQLKVPDPRLWSVNDPYLYTLVTQIYNKNKITDEYTARVGIRYFSFDAEKGFTLNGKPMKIYGVCNHHDL